jgi:hypothetical protein
MRIRAAVRAALLVLVLESAAAVGGASRAQAGGVSIRRAAVPAGYARCFSLVAGKAAPFASGPSGYGPADLQSACKLPSATAGSGQTVAIVDAFDDPTAESDLAQYRSFYGLPPCTTANGCFRKVNQTGGTIYPVPSADWALEISLDFDMVSAVCPNCHILLVESNTNLDSDSYAAEDTAAALGASAISNTPASGSPSAARAPRRRSSQASTPWPTTPRASTTARTRTRTRAASSTS